MSMNLYIQGYGMAPCQTTTEISYWCLADLHPGTCLEQDIEVMEKARIWYHQVSDPEPLKGKDARNPFLVKDRQQQIDFIDEQVDDAIRFLKENTKGVRLTYVA